MTGVDQDLYFISVAARMLGMHPQTLRKYERLGLVQPTRTIGSMRLYSREELERLKLIKRLVDDAGINLAGVQRLLSIAEVVQRLRPLVRDDSISARDTRRRLVQELDELSRMLGFGWNVNFGRGAGGQGGFRTMTEDEMREMFGDENPFSDFFQTFFGGSGADTGRRARGARGRAARVGRDVEHELELGLEDAYHGATRRLTLRHDGHSRTVDVRIPPGVGEGSRVRVPGEGEHGTGGAQSGDLYLRIHLASHPQFERKGKDLHTHVSVPLTTA